MAYHYFQITFMKNDNILFLSYIRNIFLNIEQMIFKNKNYLDVKLYLY